METSGADEPPAIRIQVFEFGKADLQSLPPAERRALILGGHSLNQLGLWMKFLAVTVNHQSGDAILDAFNAAQSQAIVRLLCGTLFEIWNWMNRSSTSAMLKKQYRERLPEEAKEAYRRLGRSFGSGLLGRIRNSFAFHMPNDKVVDAAFLAASSDDDYNWYLSDENTNSLYLGSETVIGHGLHGFATKEVDGRAGFARLNHEAVAAVNDINQVIQALLFVIVSEHLGDRPRSQFHVSGSPGPRFGLPFLMDRVLGD